MNGQPEQIGGLLLVLFLVIASAVATSVLLAERERVRRRAFYDHIMRTMEAEAKAKAWAEREIAARRALFDGLARKEGNHASHGIEAVDERLPEAPQRADDPRPGR